jgi:hypothetical protein
VLEVATEGEARVIDRLAMPTCRRFDLAADAAVYADKAYNCTPAEAALATEGSAWRGSVEPTCGSTSGPTSMTYGCIAKSIETVNR